MKRKRNQGTRWQRPHRNAARKRQPQAAGGKPPVSPTATLVPVPPNALYRPDETPKRKHHWDRDEPGFVELFPGHRVGKCPRSLTPDRAEALLRQGIGFNPAGWKNAWVDRIYVVHGGTVYRATITNSAEPSYHGFPELLSRLPPHRALRERLAAMAAAEGEESVAQLSKWLKEGP